MISSFFQPPLICCILTQVITDPLTGRSKGYGFVRFGNEAERDRSLTEMSGHIINSRPIRVSVATAKKSQNSAMVSTVLRGRVSALLLHLRTGVAQAVFACSMQCKFAMLFCAELRRILYHICQSAWTVVAGVQKVPEAEDSGCRLVVPTHKLTHQTMIPPTPPSSSVDCPLA